MIGDNETATTESAASPEPLAILADDDVAERMGEGAWGDPRADAALWRQQSDDFTCAVVSICGVVEALTGDAISEVRLTHYATNWDRLTTEGMYLNDVEFVLESLGVPAHTVAQGATVEDLIGELALGRKIVLGVDSGELRGLEPAVQELVGRGADHAIWLTGINTTDPDNPCVVINDSNDPEGAGRSYPLSAFLAAWQDSGFGYVATDAGITPDPTPEGALPAEASATGAAAAGLALIGLVLAARPGFAAKLTGLRRLDGPLAPGALGHPRLETLSRPERDALHALI